MPSPKNPLDPHERARLDADTLNNITQTVALLAAGAWAVYTFVYQQMIQPAQSPPTLTVSSVLETAGSRGSITALQCSVTRTNVGQSSVRVLGLTYNLTGIKERFLVGGGVNPHFGAPMNLSHQISRLRYQLEPERQEVIARNGTLFAGAHNDGSASELNPQESVTRNLVFYADRSRFDRVRLHVTLVFERADDPGIPLVLEVGNDEMLEARISPTCRARAGTDCAAIYTTDFNTELSLWK